MNAAVDLTPFDASHVRRVQKTTVRDLIDLLRAQADIVAQNKERALMRTDFLRRMRKAKDWQTSFLDRYLSFSQGANPLIGSCTINHKAKKKRDCVSLLQAFEWGVGAQDAEVRATSMTNDTVLHTSRVRVSRHALERLIQRKKTIMGTQCLDEVGAALAGILLNAYYLEEYEAGQTLAIRTPNGLGIVGVLNSQEFVFKTWLAELNLKPELKKRYRGIWLVLPRRRVGIRWTPRSGCALLLPQRMG